MILVDDRIGSQDLLEPLQRAGLPAELIRLEAADVAFQGRGRGGRSVMVGVELKKLGDLVSSLRSGRLGGEQLPKMLGPQGAYDYGWLLVEGRWQVDKFGRVLELKRRGATPLPGRMSGIELEKQVLTLELCGGFHVRYTPDRAGTLHFLTGLYRWFTDKDMDDHTSHLAVHTPTGFLPVSDFRQVVSRFPHVGLRTSLAVETHFGGNLIAAVTATPEAWAGIQTVTKQGKLRRLGVKAGQEIVAFCRGKR